jgi:hypothetical protein
VVDLNLHRRHLNESQRAMIAARLANMVVGGREANAQICAIAKRRQAHCSERHRRPRQPRACASGRSAIGRGPGKSGGDKYEAVIEATGLSYGSVANSKSVSDKFRDFSRRREKLSWRHHADVSGLSSERADELLSLAETNRWSTRRLREEAGGAPSDAPLIGNLTEHNHRAQGTGEKWGDKYEAVIEATGLSYNTINNTKTVTKAFEFTRRRVNLSFTHHVEVASLAVLILSAGG